MIITGKYKRSNHLINSIASDHTNFTDRDTFYQSSRLVYCRSQRRQIHQRELGNSCLLIVRKHRHDRHDVPITTTWPKYVQESVIHHRLNYAMYLYAMLKLSNKNTCVHNRKKQYNLQECAVNQKQFHFQFLTNRTEKLNFQDSITSSESHSYNFF